MGGTPLALGVGGPIARVRAKRPMILEALAGFVGSFEDRVRPEAG
jgi:hypothetical protein